MNVVTEFGSGRKAIDPGLFRINFPRVNIKNKWPALLLNNIFQTFSDEVVGVIGAVIGLRSFYNRFTNGNSFLAD